MGNSDNDKSMKRSSRYSRSRSRSRTRTRSRYSLERRTTNRRRPISPYNSARRKPFHDDTTNTQIANNSRSSRLERPEVQLSPSMNTDSQTESYFSKQHPSDQALSMSERITRATMSGTAMYNSKRRYGRFASHDQLPHLIITNNLKLPTATLFRQAKEISIVVERTIGSNNSTTNSSKTDNPARFVLPRRPTEGFKAVFDRPEIKFYEKKSEESMIVRRLRDHIMSSESGRKSSNSTSSQFDDFDKFSGPGRFYGSRVDERYMDSKSAYARDPAEAPKGLSYYHHDDRTEDDNGYHRSRYSQGSRMGYRRNAGRQRDDRSRHLSDDHYKSEWNTSSQESSKRWVHDKYCEQEGENLNNTDPTTTYHQRAPKPVPAPKPILWSTIGKEINNVENASENLDQSDKSRSDSHGDSLSNKLPNTDNLPSKDFRYDNEDVRIDIEPILVETME